MLMILTYTFLRYTRARYDATSNCLPLEVATVMDISVGQDEEMKKQRRQEGIMMQQNPGASPSEVGTDSVSSKASEDEESHGQMIGEDDPFELAYVQPVIRASPHARPEQPFPPVSLRRCLLLDITFSYKSYSS